MHSQWSHSQCLVSCNSVFPFPQLGCALDCFLTVTFLLFFPIWHFSSSPSLITTISYPAKIELRGHRWVGGTGKFLLDWYCVGWFDILNCRMFFRNWHWAHLMAELAIWVMDFFSSWPVFFSPPSFFSLLFFCLFFPLLFFSLFSFTGSLHKN